MVIECGSAKCSAQALFLVHWPGKPIELCRPCTDWASKIADTMGFKLIVEPNVASRVANLTEEQKAEMAAYMMEHDDAEV